MAIMSHPYPPIPPHTWAAHSKLHLSKPGWGGGGEVCLGGVRGAQKVLDSEFLLHPQFWGGDQEFGVPIFLASAPINLPSDEIGNIQGGMALDLIFLQNQLLGS